MNKSLLVTFTIAIILAKPCLSLEPVKKIDPCSTVALFDLPYLHAAKNAGLKPSQAIKRVKELLGDEPYKDAAIYLATGIIFSGKLELEEAGNLFSEICYRPLIAEHDKCVQMTKQVAMQAGKAVDDEAIKKTCIAIVDELSTQ